MTEWTVVGVIVVLVGLIASVVKPLITLNTTLTHLTDAVTSLKENLNDYTAANETSHKAMWKKINEHRDQITDHDHRIEMLENK